MRRNAFPIFAFAFYLVTIVYPVLRIWWWYNPTNLFLGATATLVMLTFLSVPLGLFLSRFVFRLRMPKRLMPTLYSAIGCCFLFFPIVLVLEFVRWIPGFPNGFESPVAVACVSVCAIYAFLNAQQLHVKTVRITGKPEIENQSIVQLSDVHIGSRSPKYLERIVKKVKKLNPTWVVITGDLLDSPSVGSAELEPLRQIAERTLLVTGNHERYEGIDRITSIVESIGITVLRNEEVDTR
ncbi:MAG: metallophosphoesterase, partial [Gammaproteobacteria bacterium]|nr:metallophosphoesterase [Gammaproteobacteria bacterium]